jgi:hypothetical protein
MDNFLTKLATESDILPLSFHVTYWDNLGWKDPFSSKPNTDRQIAYLKALGLPRMFTPQTVIDGQKSVAGFQEQSVRSGIASVREHLTTVPMTLAPDKTGRNLALHIGTSSDPATGDSAAIWVIGFNRTSTTAVGAGENSGKVLKHTNNVMSVTKLDIWKDKEADFTLPFGATEGIAVILQDEPVGRIYGVASYINGGDKTISEQPKP